MFKMPLPVHHACDNLEQSTAPCLLLHRPTLSQPERNERGALPPVGPQSNALTTWAPSMFLAAPAAITVKVMPGVGRVR